MFCSELHCMDRWHALCLDGTTEDHGGMLLSLLQMRQSAIRGELDTNHGLAPG
jgi:hypothetical protein